MSGTPGGREAAAGIIGLLRCDGHAFGIPSEALLEVAPVGTLDTLLSPEPAVLGAVRLRGSLIPVLDPFALCGLPRMRAEDGAGCAIAAVLTDGTAMVALGVSGIAGLRRCARDEVQGLGAGSAALSGHALLDGEIVHILDPASLLARSDIPRAARRLRRRSASSGADHSKHLIFAAGDAVFALTAEHISGTVPRQDLAERWLGSGESTGCLRVQGRRVPVIDPGGLLGLGAPARDGAAEYVVLRMPEDRLVAFAVDDVCRIQPVPRERVRLWDDGPSAASALIAGTFEWDGRMVFLLDAARLRSDPRLATLAELSDRDQDDAQDREAAKAGPDPGETGQGVIRERVRHIVFRAGGRVAAPIGQVARIIVPPAELTLCRAAVPGLCGLFLVDDQPVPLIDLSVYRGQAPPGQQVDARVLLARTEAGLVGLLAEAVEGIADSDWRSCPDARMPGGGDLVQLRLRGAPVVLERLDLQAMADAIRARWRSPLAAGTGTEGERALEVQRA